MEDRASGPGVEGLAVLHHFSGRRIVVVVECNGSRCHEQSAQTATPPLTLVTAIKILENNKEGHAGRGQRGLHRPSPPEGSTDANERRGPPNGRKNVSIKNHRRTFFVATAAANAAIKSRQRRSTERRGSLLSLSGVCGVACLRVSSRLPLGDLKRRWRCVPQDHVWRVGCTVEGF